MSKASDKSGSEKGGVVHGKAAGVYPIDLRDDEHIITSARISAGIYWKGLVVLFFAILVWVFVAQNLGILFLAVAALMLLVAYMTKFYLLMVLTSQRVMVRHGIIKLDTTQMRLSRIESVEVERTIPGQIMGYSNVIISGTGSRYTVVPFVANGTEFRDKLDNLLHEMEERGYKGSDSGD